MGNKFPKFNLVLYSIKNLLPHTPLGKEKFISNPNNETK